MSSTPQKNDHDHAHAQERSHDKDAPCCGAERSSGDAASTLSAMTTGRSFQVSGLDCAEEVAILNKVVGPKVGGSEHLAFDVINGRMTILDSADRISDDAVVQLVATTGMSAGDTVHFWYASGVGKVREERPMDGTIEELVSFDIPGGQSSS